MRRLRTKRIDDTAPVANGGTEGEVPGIVINRGPAELRGAPRIAAFIWGGKVRPTPTLPYGRWKGAA